MSHKTHRYKGHTGTKDTQVHMSCCGIYLSFISWSMLAKTGFSHESVLMRESSSAESWKYKTNIPINSDHAMDLDQYVHVQSDTGYL